VPTTLSTALHHPYPKNMFRKRWSGPMWRNIAVTSLQYSPSPTE